MPSFQNENNIDFELSRKTGNIELITELDANIITDISAYRGFSNTGS